MTMGTHENSRSSNDFLPGADRCVAGGLAPELQCQALERRQRDINYANEQMTEGIRAYTLHIKNVKGK